MPNPAPFQLVSALRSVWVLLAASAAALPALAQTVHYTGASVSGTASGRMELSCSTCTNYPIFFSNEAEVGLASAGGAGFVSAAVDRVAVIDRGATLGSFPDDPNTLGPDYTLGGGTAYAAEASFSGPLATPLLRARASTDNVRVYLLSLPPDPNLFVGWDYFSASAGAYTTQGYTFSGSVRTTYTFEFTFDGLLQDPRANLSASATVHNGDAETGVRSFANASLSTTLLSGSEYLSRSFSIGMTFEPGETLYLDASLMASADANVQFGLPDEGIISADGMNTMWVSSISGGDINLLTPMLTVTAIPEPATTVMLVLGLGALAGLQRRRGAVVSKP